MNQTILQKLLNHPWINKAGVAFSVYPQKDREVSRLLLRKRKSDFKTDELEQMEPELVELHQITGEMLSALRAHRERQVISK